MLRERLGVLGRSEKARLAVLGLGGMLLIALFRGGPDGVSVGQANPDARAKMPEVLGTDLNGHPWKLMDRRGSVEFVNFWASRSPPCRTETPGLVRVANEYQGRGVQFVGVSMDDTAAPARRFAAQYHVPYPVVMPAGNSGPASTIESLPTSVLLDRQGRVAKTYVGAIRERELRQDLDILLTEK